MNLSLSIGKRNFRLQIGKNEPARTQVVKARRVPTGQNTGSRMFATAEVSRLTADWGISITSADAEILVSAIATRSRMRQMERDDDYFRGMLWLLENNIIGDQGIRLRMKVRQPDGKKLNETLNKAIQDAWQQAMEDNSCTVSRERNGIEIQRLSVRALARDGVIIHRKYRGHPNDFGFALEPIEVDRLDHWWNRPSVGLANEIKFGIERDRFKAAVAYYLLTRHPGDTFAYSTEAKYRERVLADEIIPIWTIERAGQSIGMPLWPSVAKRLHNLWGYEESEQIAARAAAAKGGFFEVPKDATQDEYIGEEDEQGNKLMDMQPGQWEQLPVGWQAKSIDPKHPTEAFPHFLKAQLRGASAGSGIPYNSVAQDLESVNYSSYKAGMNDARDGFKYLQDLMVRKLMRPWFRAWLPMAVMAGKIPGMTMADVDKVKMFDDWSPRRWAGLEPLKETQAQVLAVEAGFDSRRNIIAEDYNRDIEEVFDDQQHDNDLADQHGLDFSQDVKKPVVGSGHINDLPDTDTSNDGKGGNGKANGKARNGHSGNGHEVTSELLKELRAQRYDFRELSKRSAGPITFPERISLERAEPVTKKRKLKVTRDTDGGLIVDELREEN